MVSEKLDLINLDALTEHHALTLMSSNGTSLCCLLFWVFMWPLSSLSGAITYQWVWFLWNVLGAFTKLRKTTISFVMSVHPSVRVEKQGAHWRDIHEIWYLSIFRKSAKKIKVSLKSNMNDRYFTWRPIYIFDHIGLISSQNEKCCRQNSYRKPKHTFWIQ